jgi:hypothetical protein
VCGWYTCLLSFEEEFENGEREIIERIEPIGKKKM